MPDNDIGWGQGAVNNDIGWGKGATNNDIDWGAIHADSPSNDTNLTGAGDTPSFTNTKSLDSAINFITEINHPVAGILIDLMHINRSDEKLPNLNNPLFPYIQGCDFYQSSKELSGDDYILAAIDDRCCLSQGEADQDEILKMSLSNLDVSLEIRSKNLRDKFPSPQERANYIFKNCIRENN